MQLKPYLIDTLGKLLLSDRFWNDVKQFVADAQSTTLSGPEKKAKVIGDLQAVFGDVSTFALNLGIELAKAYVAVQAPEFAPLVNVAGTKIEEATNG